MRWNEAEVVSWASQAPDWEGQLLYKSPKPATPTATGARLLKAALADRVSPDFKNRWFRLRGNCLFYFRVSSGFGNAGVARPAPGTEPLGVLVLENSHVQQEGFAKSVHAFSIIFAEEPEKKHLFLGDSQRCVSQWLEVLKKARYEALREKLLNLQIKLRTRTGQDPLLGTGFEYNPIYCPKIPAEVTAPNFDTGASTPPQPKPRTKSSKATFKSHVVENWEPERPAEEEVGQGASKKPTFQSHVQVPEGNLIDLG